MQEKKVENPSERIALILNGINPNSGPRTKNIIEEVIAETNSNKENKFVHIPKVYLTEKEKREVREKKKEKNLGIFQSKI